MTQIKTFLKRFGIIFLNTSSVLIFFIAGFYSLFFAGMAYYDYSKKDDFAKGLSIPAELQAIELYEYLDPGGHLLTEDLSFYEQKIWEYETGKNEEIFSLLPAFSMYGSPGVYHFFLFHRIEQPGVAYVKAYEATQNIPLSPADIARESIIEIDGIVSPGEIRKEKTRFFLREGNYEDRYAARIEAWFAPADGTPPYKMGEKIFVVGGHEGFR